MSHKLGVQPPRFDFPHFPPNSFELLGFLRSSGRVPGCSSDSGGGVSRGIPPSSRGECRCLAWPHKQNILGFTKADHFSLKQSDNPSVTEGDHLNKSRLTRSGPLRVIVNTMRRPDGQAPRSVLTYKFSEHKQQEIKMTTSWSHAHASMRAFYMLDSWHKFRLQ